MKKLLLLAILMSINALSLSAQVDLSGAVTSIRTIGSQVSGVLCLATISRSPQRQLEFPIFIS